MRKWIANEKFYFTELEPQMDSAVYLSVIQPGETIYESPEDEYDAIWVKNTWYLHNFGTVGWKSFCTFDSELSGQEANDLWETSETDNRSADSPRWRVDETAKTEDYTVETTDLDGRLFTNEGAVQDVQFSLPPCADGYIFSATVRSSNGITITPNGTNSIIGLDDGESTDSTTVGNSLVLRGNASGVWEVLGKYGDWSGLTLGGTGTDGAPNQLFKGDGSGNMSWTALTEDSSGNLSLPGYAAKYQINGINTLGMEVTQGIELGAGAEANGKQHALALGTLSQAERYGEFVINMDHQQACKHQKSEVFWCGTVAAAPTPAWTELFLHATTNYRCLVLANSAVRAEIHISALDSNGSCASYLVKALIRRDGSNVTTLEWSSVTAEFEDVAAWDVRVTADDTNEALKLEVLSNDSDYDNFSVKWSAVGYLTEVRT